MLFGHTAPATRLVAAVVLAIAAGCGGGSSGSVAGMPVGALVPDFALPDVNPASATSGTNVSPRDFLGSGTAWYFGHST